MLLRLALVIGLVAVIRVGTLLSALLLGTSLRTHHHRHHHR